jgi:O-antigen ligase
MGDILVFAALVILFIELLKSTTSRRIAIINHSLSMVLFIVCLVEFLLFRAFATSAFFLITSMVLLDVLAGFIVTIVASRREIDMVN